MAGKADIFRITAATGLRYNFVMAIGRQRKTKVDTLGNILRLEGRNGFRDISVVGGLDEFLRRWEDELRPALDDGDDNRDAPLSYAAMSAAERRKWADGVLGRIVRFAPSDDAVAPGAGGSAPVRQNAPRLSPPKTAQRRQRKQSGSRSKPPAPSKPVSLADPVEQLRTVTARVKPKLANLGIRSVADLIYHFPHRHDDFTKLRTVSQIVPGEVQTLIATVWEVREIVGRNRRTRSAQAVLGDHTGNIRVTWFNQGYLVRRMTPGTRLVISGTAKVYRGQIVFQSPEYDFLTGEEETAVHAGRLVPVYPLTDGLFQRTMRNCVHEALQRALEQVQEFVPNDALRRNGLLGLRESISQMHYPEAADKVEHARRRLAFDELLMLQLTVAQRRLEWQAGGGASRLRTDTELLDSFFDSLPFALTAAQRRVVGEILADIDSEIPMSRLLQGDVGSGKTVVAAAALLVAAFNGFQSVLMAPTELLAEQHFLTISKMLNGGADVSGGEVYASVDLPLYDERVRLGLLIGSMRKRLKDDMRRFIAAGAMDIVVGTQALIQDAVDIPNLALVVVDEQHRFGVMQRNTLRNKGKPPHMLAMSATPIPRSVRLTMLGDLDLSTIDELPPGRQKIRTRWVEPKHRASAYATVRSEASAGRQAFIICPLIEESEAIQARAATEEYERLSAEVFPEYRLGLLHGRMGIDEKEAVMREFQDGSIDILVATSVIEVGIDVANATVMLVDGADRFGLAQLHQFRGRVGRGEHPSQCLLLSDSAGTAARERIRILERTMDGFEIAEEDLRIRGAGEYMGTRQSGLNDMKMARMTDQDIMLMARKEALALLRDDPNLSDDAHAGLAKRLVSYSERNPVEMS